MSAAFWEGAMRGWLVGSMCLIAALVVVDLTLRMGMPSWLAIAGGFGTMVAGFTVGRPK